MAILLFFLALVASFLVVRLGAVALELTGIEPKQAQFQSLSAFSGAGFTTREAELVLLNPARRKVIQLLIIGGNAGLVTMIATLGITVASGTAATEGITLFGGLVSIPAPAVPYVKLGSFIVILVLLYRVAQIPFLSRVIQRVLKRFVERHGLVRRVAFEEVMLDAEGYGVSQIEIRPDNPLLDRTLANSGLSERDILVLMIRRGEQIIPSPKGKNFARVGDRFTVFGPLQTIREMAVAEDERDEPSEQTEAARLDITD